MTRRIFGIIGLTLLVLFPLAGTMPVRAAPEPTEPPRVLDAGWCTLTLTDPATVLVEWPHSSIQGPLVMFTSTRPHRDVLVFGLDWVAVSWFRDTDPGWRLSVLRCTQDGLKGPAAQPRGQRPFGIVPVHGGRAIRYVAWDGDSWDRWEFWPESGRSVRLRTR